MRLETLLVALLVACGSDASPSSDGGVDSSTQGDVGASMDSAASDGGVLDSGLGVAYRCGNYGPQPSCAQCEQLTGGTNTQPCVYCSDAGYVGVCIKPGLSCITARPNDLDWCPCGPNADPSPCPLSTDVCIAVTSDDAGACYTCGGPASDGGRCQNGGTCDPSTGACN